MREACVLQMTTRTGNRLVAEPDSHRLFLPGDAAGLLLAGHCGGAWRERHDGRRPDRRVRGGDVADADAGTESGAPLEGTRRLETLIFR